MLLGLSAQAPAVKSGMSIELDRLSADHPESGTIELQAAASYTSIGRGRPFRKFIKKRIASGEIPGLPSKGKIVTLNRHQILQPVAAVNAQRRADGSKTVGGIDVAASPGIRSEPPHIAITFLVEAVAFFTGVVGAFGVDYIAVEPLISHIDGAILCSLLTFQKPCTLL